MTRSPAAEANSRAGAAGGAPFKPDLALVWRETLRGKTLARAFENMAWRQVRLSGRGIDLGAKSDSSSYYRFLQRDGAQITFSDLRPTRPGMLQVDLEREIPVPDASQDFLILSNVLEHVYDYRRCLSECVRVLKPFGKLYGAVPYLYHVHPDPDDHWRFSASALRRILGEAGFSQVEVRPLGCGPFTAAAAMTASFLWFKPLVFACYVLAFGLDRLMARTGLQRATPEYFPLRYFFVASR